MSDRTKADARILGHTWLGWLNLLLLQWLFVRLVAVYDVSFGALAAGDISDGRLDWLGERDGLSLAFPVVPLTGWGGPMVPRAPAFFRLTGRRR